MTNAIKTLPGFIFKPVYSNFIEEYIYAIRNKIRLKKACKLAWAYSQANGKNYYVLDGGQKRGFVIFNSLELTALKKAGIFSRRVDHIHAIKLSAYYTGWGKDYRKAQEEAIEKSMRNHLRKSHGKG